MKETAVIPCICGAMPVIDKKIIATDYEDDMPVEKWRCPNCKEKELPYLDGRGDEEQCVREWNRIAVMPEYRRRTLNYNEHGVCVDKPCKVFEWRRKRSADFFRVKIYFDNGVYYYCCDYWCKTSGGGKGLWIGDEGYPSMAAAKRHAADYLGKNEAIAGIVEKLLTAPLQAELF